MTRPPIPIHVSNNRAFVFNVDDAAVIRTDYRICGILGGTLPHLSQQNVFLGIPLMLMPEEAALLVNEGFAVMVDDPKAHHDPVLSQLKAWDLDRTHDIEKQLKTLQVQLETSSVHNAEKSMSEAAIQKRKAREEKKRKATEAAQKAAAEASGEDLFVPETPASEMKQPSTTTPHDTALSTALDPTPSSSSTVNVPYTVSVPTTSNGFSWYAPEKYTYTTIKEAQEAGIWTYPSTEEEKAKCAVFSDLWHKGYYMGGGIKFGGDWLVYPGDPLRYHSHFAATVQASPTASLLPMEVVAHGRLGTATKKAHVLCGWDPETKEVTYLSIEWAGFG